MRVCVCVCVRQCHERSKRTSTGLKEQHFGLLVKCLATPNSLGNPIDANMFVIRSEYITIFAMGKNEQNERVIHGVIIFTLLLHNVFNLL